MIENAIIAILLYIETVKHFFLDCPIYNYNAIPSRYCTVVLDFSLTVKAATLIFIFGCGSAISSAKEGKSGFIYNLVKS